MLGYKPPRRRSVRPGSGSTRQRTAGASRLPESVGFQFFAANPFDALSSNTFYAPVLAGAQSEASALGLNLLLHTTDRHSLSQGVPKMALDQAISGMLLVGTADPHVLDTFAAHVPHIILVDNHDENGVHESVSSDGFGGAHEATRYLLSLGHRRIGFYLPEAGVTTFQDRLRGYVCALFENGIAPDPARIITASADADDNAREAELASALAVSDITALIAANDHNALLVCRALRLRGRRVPDDLSLVGFDDIELVRHTDPALTTIRVDKERLGRLAVRRIHTRLHSDLAVLRAEGTLRHQAPVSLVVRDSCRAV